MKTTRVTEVKGGVRQRECAKLRSFKEKSTRMHPYLKQNIAFGNEMADETSE